MLRTLISEGRLDHNVAVPQADGSPVTKHVRRNGPVAVIITSARDNLEEEMLTRLMTSDADESPEQTLDVLADVLSGEDRSVDKAEVARWLDFQRWLELNAPYDVVIPFSGAILAAYKKRLAEIEARGERPRVKLRAFAAPATARVRSTNPERGDTVDVSDVDDFIAFLNASGGFSIW